MTIVSRLICCYQNHCTLENDYTLLHRCLKQPLTLCKDNSKSCQPHHQFLLQLIEVHLVIFIRFRRQRFSWYWQILAVFSYLLHIPNQRRWKQLRYILFEKTAYWSDSQVSLSVYKENDIWRFISLGYLNDLPFTDKFMYTYRFMLSVAIINLDRIKLIFWCILTYVGRFAFKKTPNVSLA